LIRGWIFFFQTPQPSLVGYSYRESRAFYAPPRDTPEVPDDNQDWRKGQLTVPKQFREDLGLGLAPRLPFCVWEMA